MSCMIDIRALSEDDKFFIQESLECDEDAIYDMNGNNLYVPFSFARLNFELEDERLETTEDNKFEGTLRKEQKKVCEYIIDKNGTGIISSQPGFGKTITSLAIACKLKLKTLIIVNKVILLDQWIQSLKKFVPSAKTKILTPKNYKLGDESFYIINAINIMKKPYDFWSPIKFVIVDEFHQIVTKKLSKALLRLRPGAILGLSATPYRYDDYDRAIKWFFGNDVIGEQLIRKHFYRVVSTGWTPIRLEYGSKGLNWGKILEEQAGDDKRNAIIVRECIAELENGKTILILVKRTLHAERLMDMLAKAGIEEKVDKLLRSDVTFDRNCRILIGTTSKIGVGFDHSPIDCLFVAADVKNYFVQFLGRCMRCPDKIPTVVDFDDEFQTLKKHLKLRVDEYRIHGGVNMI